MEYTELRAAPEKENPHGVSARMLYDRENAQAVHLALEPGQALRRHVTPVDVFFYVLEGEATVEVGEERLQAVADTLVESPAQVPHRILNQGESLVRVLVVKAPRPTKATRLL